MTAYTYNVTATDNNGTESIIGVCVKAEDTIEAHFFVMAHVVNTNTIDAYRKEYSLHNARLVNIKHL